jgi:hypothetical protein
MECRVIDGKQKADPPRAGIIPGQVEPDFFDMPV